MPSGGGWWVSAQSALMGGGWGKGGWCWSNPYHLPWVTRYSMLMLSPHDQGGRPWNLLLLLMGPGPFSLMQSARSNKSSSEGDTFIIKSNHYVDVSLSNSEFLIPDINQTRSGHHFSNNKRRGRKEEIINKTRGKDRKTARTLLCRTVR
jgi:hypothetical protein